MKGTKIILSVAAIMAAGAGTAGIVLNSKKMKRKRALKRASHLMYNAGAVLQMLSGQGCQGCCE